MSKIQLLNRMKPHSACAIGGALILSVLAPAAAQAASFTVQYTAFVDSLYELSSTADQDFGRDVDSSVTPNTGKSVALGDRVAGSYTFDDQTGEISSSRVRFVSPSETRLFDPAIKDDSDIIFKPSLLGVTSADGFPEDEINRRDISSAADERSATYTQFATTDTREFINTLNYPNFSYTEALTVLDVLSLTRVKASGGSYLLIPGELEPEPTSVPEPAAVFGLIALGLGLSQLRDNRAQKSAS